MDGSPYYKSIGCYFNRNDQNAYAWSEGEKDLTDLTLESCITICEGRGEFEYVGMEYGKECWCSAESPDSLESRDGECNMPCSGDPVQVCGGSQVISVHKIKPGRAKYIKPLNLTNPLSIR